MKKKGRFIFSSKFIGSAVRADDDDADGDHQFGEIISW